MKEERIEKNIISGVTGKAVPLGGHDIDTDRIIPGRFLLCTSFSGLGDNAFADDKKTGGHPFSDPVYRSGSILLSGRNFGCGSSREHAAQALRRWGIQAVVAESFAEIFLDNARACGIVCVRLKWEKIQELTDRVKQKPEEEMTVDIKRCKLKMCGDEYPLEMDKAVQGRFLNGTWDVLDVLLSVSDKIESRLKSLPYMQFQVQVD